MTGIFRTKQKVLGILLLLPLWMWSCKDQYQSVIPSVPVMLDINLGNQIDLQIPTGVAIFPLHGYGGIVVYCEIPNELYYAYDRACTKEISTSCPIVPEGGVAVCSCCQSQFLLTGGTAQRVSGEAIQPLRQYRTSLAGGRLLIRN